MAMRVRFPSVSPLTYGVVFMELTKANLETACSNNLSIKELRALFRCKNARLYAALKEFNIQRIPLRAGAKQGNKHIFRSCPVCNSLFQDKHGNRKECCTRKCTQTLMYRRYIERWLKGEVSGLSTESVSSYIRRYFHEKHNSCCSKCGWSEIHPITKKVPLQINHIDGDYTNCKFHNLELLCPNCHSLTPTFGSLNTSGKGRPKKMKKV